MLYIKNKPIILLLIAYVGVTMYLMIENASLYTNIVNPIFWGMLLLYLLWDCKKNYIRFCSNRKYAVYMCILAGIHVVAFFYIGFLFGFSKSPYSHEFTAICKNAILLILPIISIEVARGVIANRNKNNKFVLVGITLLCILIEMQYDILWHIASDRELFFQYTCSTIIPTIAGNCLYTYLTLKGSYILPCIYRIASKGMLVVLPILPAIDWFLTGTIGILSPAIVFLLFQYVFTKVKTGKRKKQKQLGTKIAYGVTVMFSITLISFMLGLFPYKAITILSNSMVPTFSRGDVVIYKTLNEEEVKNIPENAIIVYRIGTQNIVHRVKARMQGEDAVRYQTKGDKNNTVDSHLVEIEQIQGIYICHISYVGMPSVWLYQYFHTEDAKVEIQ